MHSLNVLEDSGWSLILFLRASSLLPVLECFQSYYRACDLLPRGGGGGGDSAYEMGGDARRLAEGSKFRILVSLRVLWAKRHHI